MKRYSDDRLSLAQEIKETLEARGYWVPKEWAGPDLIMALGLALDEASRNESLCFTCRKDLLEEEG